MIDDERMSDPEPSVPLPATPVPYIPSAVLPTPAPLHAPRWGDDDVIAARELFARVVRSTFDALDNVGDSIATAIGLR
jgi:hypothetical protein